VFAIYIKTFSGEFSFGLYRSLTLHEVQIELFFFISKCTSYEELAHSINMDLLKSKTFA